MVRVRLLGIDTEIRDEELEKKLVPFLSEIGDSFARASVLDKIAPGLLEAVLLETRTLNRKGLRAAEMIIWDGNKVRVNPGPNFVDPRSPDEYTEFL